MLLGKGFLEDFFLLPCFNVAIIYDEQIHLAPEKINLVFEQRL